jgi:hypothetical protein
MTEVDVRALVSFLAAYGLAIASGAQTPSQKVHFATFCKAEKASFMAFSLPGNWPFLQVGRKVRR